LDRSIQTLVLAPAMLMLASCGVLDDPVTRQLSTSGSGAWMERVELRHPSFQKGQRVSQAVDLLSDWGWEDGQELLVAYEHQIEEPLSVDKLVFAKSDTNKICGLNRFVFIEHVDGKIVSASGATGEAGCL